MADAEPSPVTAGGLPPTVFKIPFDGVRPEGQLEHDTRIVSLLVKQMISPLDWDGNDRGEAVRRARLAAGLPVDESMHFEPDTSSLAHGQRVADFLLDLFDAAEELGHTEVMAVPRRDIYREQLHLGARIHDIGKTIEPVQAAYLKSIQEGVVLREEEIDLIRAPHAAEGAKILLTRAKGLSQVIQDLVRTHHQWPSGGEDSKQNYPPKDPGVTDVPLPGRLAAIADNYDVMKGLAPERVGFVPPLTPAEIYEGMKSFFGTKFDASLLPAFQLMMAKDIVRCIDTPPKLDAVEMHRRIEAKFTRNEGEVRRSLNKKDGVITAEDRELAINSMYEKVISLVNPQTYIDAARGLLEHEDFQSNKTAHALLEQSVTSHVQQSPAVLSLPVA